MPLSGNTLVVCISVSLDQDTLTEKANIYWIELFLLPQKFMMIQIYLRKSY